MMEDKFQKRFKIYRITGNACKLTNIDLTFTNKEMKYSANKENEKEIHKLKTRS